MPKGRTKKTDINKNLPNNSKKRDENLDQLCIALEDEQKVYLQKLANVLSKIKVKQPDGSIKPLIPDKTLTSFGRSALSFMSNIYLNEVLTKSEIASAFDDKEAFNEFVAFRAKYMNFPVDKQIEDFKRVGVVK